MSPGSKRVSKPASSTRKAAPKAVQVPTAEERASMIAVAAYYKAEQRGFSEGDPQRDWWEAEREIDALLTTSGGRGKRIRVRKAQGS